MNIERPAGAGSASEAVPPVLGSSAPDRIPASSGQVRRASPGWWVLGGLLLVAALAVLYGHRPAGQYFYPRCSLHASTGWLCPGCGGLRATHELLHGHVLSALRLNALLVLGIPVAAAWWGWQRSRGRPFLAVSTSVVGWGLAVGTLYGVLRNLPGWPFEYLAP